MTTLCLADLKPVRMSCQGGQAKAVRGAIAVRPNFFPELVGVNERFNEQRLAEYKAKRKFLPCGRAPA